MSKSWGFSGYLIVLPKEEPVTHTPKGYENEPPTCARCETEYSLRDGMEVSKYCDLCAQERVSELEPIREELLKALKEICECGLIHKAEQIAVAAIKAAERSE